MVSLDNRLIALSGAAVLQSEEEGGHMTFSPSPVITASDDQILAHEICHVIGGRGDYEIFETAIIARNNNPIFKYILNILYDWYHEYCHGQKYQILKSRLEELHQRFPIHESTGEEAIDNLWKIYADRNVNPSSMGINDVIDLVAYADNVTKKISDPLALMTKIAIGSGEELLDSDLDSNQARKGWMGGPHMDIGIPPTKSNQYYLTSVSKYNHIIEALSKLWIRNKLSNHKNYYGEVDWKNLVGMFLGQKLSLPVWNQWKKDIVNRKVYLVVDRSGSTGGITDIIMDTAIIITESFRRIGVPVSILDVGVTDDIINTIAEPIDTSWFIPMNRNGTPLGEVCHKISDSNTDSYLLIITDGCPFNWDTLTSAIKKFKGVDLTFVIGDSYHEYIKRIRNTVRVEPHTIIRTLANTSILG